MSGRPLVWTVRVEGEPTPCLWVTHEGEETARFIERYVAQCVALGYTVIVGLSNFYARPGGSRSVQ